MGGELHDYVVGLIKELDGETEFIAAPILHRSEPNDPAPFAPSAYADSRGKPSVETTYHRTDEKPAFRIIRPSDQHEMIIYANGCIEGFPDDHSVIVNRIPHLIYAGIDWAQIEHAESHSDEMQNAVANRVIAENIRLNEILAAKDARIAELKSELAARPAAFVDPEPEPAKPNPFRDFGGDRRRMGLALNHDTE